MFETVWFLSAWLYALCEWDHGARAGNVWWADWGGFRARWGRFHRAQHRYGVREETGCICNRTGTFPEPRFPSSSTTASHASSTWRSGTPSLYSRSPPLLLETAAGRKQTWERGPRSLESASAAPLRKGRESIPRATHGYSSQVIAWGRVSTRRFRLRRVGWAARWGGDGRETETTKKGAG